MTTQEDKIRDKPEFPIKFHFMEESIKSPIIDLFPGQAEGMVRGESGGLVFTPEYGRRAHKIYQFESKEDDVWICTFPKSGTTWMQEMVWLIANNCDTDVAKKTLIQLRSVFIDGEYLQWSGNIKKEIPEYWGLKALAKQLSPRSVKTHLPFSVLPPKLLDTCKVIYVARNPKDVIVSSYHHYRMFKIHDYQGSLDQFAEYTMEGKIYCSPYFPHVLEAWEKRHHPNLLFLFYEEMKQDLRGVVERVAAHLGKTVTEKQMTRVLHHLSFKQLAKTEAESAEKMDEVDMINQTGRFYRKGKTGDWKNHFSPELNERIDKWIQENLAGSDLKFVMELEQQD